MDDSVLGDEADGDTVAEPPLRVESREELVFLLGEACELEHGLMCEYLYAQFSLKRSESPGVSAEQLAQIRMWDTVLTDIVKQEMLHLALATNILTAVGAAPHFERPNFPILSRWYPLGVAVVLLPFGEQALRHFMYLERPEGMTLSDAEGFATFPGLQSGILDSQPVVAIPETWRTVGHLYRGIEAGLSELCERHGEAEVFVGPLEAQATTDIFEWAELIAVTDLDSARQAIHTIVEQGEGARGDWVDSHFGRFVGILEDFLVVRAADPSFEPALPVEPSRVRLPPDVETGPLIGDPCTAGVADLFNGLYEVTLQALTRYFVHHGETAAELDTLARTAKHLMNWVMRTLGPILATLPIGPSNTGSTAGVTFDIVRPASFFLPHREAAWRIMEERLLTLAERCEALDGPAHAGTFDALSSKLRGMAGELRAHLAERSPSQREREPRTG